MAASARAGGLGSSGEGRGPGGGRGTDGSVPVTGLGLDPPEILEHLSHGIALSEAETHLA
jgi:hypothetical protein